MPATFFCEGVVLRCATDFILLVDIIKIVTTMSDNEQGKDRSILSRLIAKERNNRAF